MNRPLLLTAACLLISGCTSGGAEQVEQTPQGPAVFGDASIEGAATLSGLVIDDSHAPIAQAELALVELSLRTLSDAGGAFRFENLPPGEYVLQVGRIGYEAAAQRIALEPEEQRQLTITLVPLAIIEPYHNTFGPFNGYFECQIGTPVAVTPCTGDTLHRQDLSSIVFPQDRRRLKFELTSEEWQTMVGEARWSRASAGTGQGLAIYPSYEKRATSHWWCEADGQSPIQFRYEKDLESVCTSSSRDPNPLPSMKLNPLIMAADPGFSGTSVDNPPLRLLAQQKFELFMTVFYHEPAPQDYTALPDA